MVKVSAIIAAYNEESTIGNVVCVLKSSPLISEVIVISDGSHDRTAERARAAGADVTHELPRQGGKGEALAHGVTHTDAPILFFADADLYGFTAEHIEKILRPVLDGQFAMCVGLRDRGKFLTWLSAYLPLISGERALQRNIFENISTKYIRGFMIEPALNYYCRSRGLSYSAVELASLTMKKKMQKVGFWKGLIQYIMMGYQIMKATVLVRTARLIGRF